MSRTSNIEVFKHTESMCSAHPALQAAIRSSVSRQAVIPQEMPLEGGIPCREREANVVVSAKRTFEAAAAYAGRKVCVLNFASATNPGGGVRYGSRAQEEGLCRCSTLYPCLNTPALWEGFYAPHRAQADPLHNDDCIYTPDVVVFKSDTSHPDMLEEARWQRVDVITCAAPNLREEPSNVMNPGEGEAVSVTLEQLQRIHEQRMARILRIAALHRCDVVVLGAFGCGAFCNDPRIVAKAYANVLPEFRHAFETVEFAVYCTKADTTNFDVFRERLGGL